MSTRALLARINRHLEKEGKALRTNRGNKWRDSLGDYYEIDFNTNAVTAQHVDPVVWAKNLGLLKDFEEVVVERVKGCSRGLKVLFVGAGGNYDINNVNQVIDELRTRECSVDYVYEQTKA